MSLQSLQASDTSTVPWCNMDVSLEKTIDAINSQEHHQASSMVLMFIPFSFHLYTVNLKYQSVHKLFNLCNTETNGQAS